MKATLTVSFLAILTFLTPSSSQAEERVLQQGDSLRITVLRGRAVSDVKDGSIGEKMAEFKPVVKIQNDSAYDFNHNRVCLIMMGQDTTDRNNWKVICRREFDANLPAGKTFEWEGESFQQGFDRTLAMSGFDYDGYIVLVKGSNGKPAIAATSKPIWTKDEQKAWSLEEGKTYKRSYFRE